MKHKPFNYAMIIMALLYLAYFSANYAQYQLSPLGGAVMERYGIDQAFFSKVFSAPLTPGIVLCLLAGLLGDRWGVRAVVTAGMLLGAAGMLWRAVDLTAAGLYGSMLLLGVAIALLNSNYAKIMGQWVDPSRLGLVGGVVLSSTSCGMAIAVGSTSLLPSLDTAYAISAALSALVAGLWLFLMRERPALIAPVLPASAPASCRPGFLQCLQAVCRSRSLWLISGCMFLMMGACVTVAAFLPTAWQELRGMDVTTSGYLTAVMMTGNMCGAVGGPYLAGRGNFRAIVVLDGCLYGLGAAFAWLLPSGPLLWLALFLAGFSLGSLFSLFLSLPALLPEVGEVYGGTGGGVVSTFQMLGATFLPGYVVVPLCGGEYRLMFYLCGLLLLLLVVLACLLPPIDFRPQRSVN